MPMVDLGAKKFRPNPGGNSSDRRSKPSSVVAAIYLGRASPPLLCATFWDGRTNHSIPVGVASGRVYMAARSPGRRGALTSPFHAYSFRCGLFLLHWPWSRLRLPLAGTLSCDARTFLAVPSSALALPHPSLAFGIVPCLPGFVKSLLSIPLVPQEPVFALLCGLNRCRRDGIGAKKGEIGEFFQKLSQKPVSFLLHGKKLLQNRNICSTLKVWEAAWGGEKQGEMAAL